MSCFFRVGLLISLPCLWGCQRAAELRFVDSKEVAALDEKLQKAIREQLEKYCGTPTQPRLIDKPEASPAALARGAEIYRSRCLACHGTTGDGNGAAAQHMYPRPRDYRAAKFKFSSTPFGVLPLRDDLVRTVRHGAKGTSMPSFALLPEGDLQAVVDHVLALTHRGELELFLAVEAESDGAINLDNTAGYIEEIVANWQKAESQLIVPETRMPPMTPQSIELGRIAFTSASQEAAGCMKCHGEDGRGKTTDNAKGFVDAWGFQTRAADLTSGMFHGGAEPIDIYRRVYGGITGTPMPSFKDKLAKEPDTIWHLVHYVQYISAARRREVMAETKARQRARSVGVNWHSKIEYWRWSPNPRISWKTLRRRLSSQMS